MGFVLFTSSGTFNPATYGLSPGDLLQVIVVGAGGGGRGSGGAGTAGGSSSFGSHATAAGGAAGVQNGLPMVTNFEGAAVTCGEMGEDGWLPGVFIERPSPHQILMDANAPAGTSKSVGLQRLFYYSYSKELLSGETAPRTDGRGGFAGTYSGSYNEMSGPGGIGYGSGGGSPTAGSSACRGAGKAGKIVYAGVLLQNTNPISVTVGTGGRGGAGGGSSKYGDAGGGCCGCVAIFW